MIAQAVKDLTEYGFRAGLIQESDQVYITNRILEELKIEDYTEPKDCKERDLEKILAVLLEFACEKGLIADSVVYRDLFDTKLMGLMTPFPREVIATFYELHKQEPQKATQWYYAFSQATDYIRRYRIQKDKRWKTKTAYGELDITINLSKPEKDPKAIAAAKNAPQSGYPKCMLCKENEGYGGRINHPARQNHRVIPIQMGGNNWFFQYSPYIYYNEHCIAFHGEHIPMKIEKDTFVKMFDFIRFLPHYFVGSNADLPIVGGSILSHDHFQGGKYTFAMEQAEIHKPYVFQGYPQIAGGIVKWPMSVIRLKSKDDKALVELADLILGKWREYTDEEAFVFAETEGEPHNTITPIARMREGIFELDLVLRNNITTPEHPLGVYHPHEKLHHIKKENIGLIEVMGLAVLPARLLEEMVALRACILGQKDLYAEEKTALHAPWAEAFLRKYPSVNEENLEGIIEEEIGLVFLEVLEDAGVFKQNEAGHAYFNRFMEQIGGEEDVK